MGLVLRAQTLLLFLLLCPLLWGGEGRLSQQPQTAAVPEEPREPPRLLHPSNVIFTKNKPLKLLVFEDGPDSITEKQNIGMLHDMRPHVGIPPAEVVRRAIQPSQLSPESKSSLV